MTLRPCVSHLRVRYAETDQMGVVHHVNYLVWCEVGRTDFLRLLGTSYADLERAGVSLPVAGLTIRYHAPARYDDPIEVTTTLSEVKSRTMTFEYLIHHGTSGALLATVQTTLISLGESGQVTALPPALREQLRGIMH
jgi:acyl-CoA thioester hydrolase